MQVKRRKYRFRILNASPSRSYKWSLSTGAPMKVIAHRRRADARAAEA